MPLWKSPDEKTWYLVKVDGKPIGVMEDSKSTEREIQRLKGLKGIEISEAPACYLRRFNAKTRIPAHIIRKMNQLNRQREVKKGRIDGGSHDQG